MIHSNETDEAYYLRAHVIPGRSNTRSKAPGKMFDPMTGPMYAVSGQGAEIMASNGRKYLDMVCGLGAISLGYNVIPTVPRQVLSLPHVSEVVASEAILEDVAPWARQVRSVRTGSEALGGAVLIAKRATGADLVFVAEGSYHGWHEWTQSAVKFEYNSLSKLMSTVAHEELRTNKRAAAIVIEPSRWQASEPSYFRAVADYAHKIGALLIMDEMIYGGRHTIGGVTGAYGIHADLACYGKAFGNGAPVAFIVGNDALKDYGELISGTYSGDPQSLSTVVDVIAFYKNNGVVAELARLGAAFRADLETAVSMVDTSMAVVEGVLPSHQRLRFTVPALAREFSTGMAARGILWHPDLFNVCYAHTNEHVEFVGESAYEVLKRIKVTHQ